MPAEQAGGADPYRGFAPDSRNIQPAPATAAAPPGPPSCHHVRFIAARTCLLPTLPYCDTPSGLQRLYRHRCRATSAVPAKTRLLPDGYYQHATTQPTTYPQCPAHIHTRTHYTFATCFRLHAQRHICTAEREPACAPA